MASTPSKDKTAAAALLSLQTEETTVSGNSRHNNDINVHDTDNKQIDGEENASTIPTEKDDNGIAKEPPSNQPTEESPPAKPVAMETATENNTETTTQNGTKNTTAKKSKRSSKKPSKKTEKPANDDGYNASLEEGNAILLNAAKTPEELDDLFACNSGDYNLCALFNSEKETREERERKIKNNEDAVPPEDYSKDRDNNEGRPFEVRRSGRTNHITKAAGKTATEEANEKEKVTNADDNSEEKDICSICKSDTTWEHIEGLDKIMQCYARNPVTNCKAIGCKRWFHPRCVLLENVPEGDWICGDCMKECFYFDDDNKPACEKAGLDFPPKGAEEWCGGKLKEDVPTTSPLPSEDEADEGQETSANCSKKKPPVRPKKRKSKSLLKRRAEEAKKSPAKNASHRGNSQTKKKNNKSRRQVITESSDSDYNSGDATESETESVNNNSKNNTVSQKKRSTVAAAASQSSKKARLGTVNLVTSDPNVREIKPKPSQKNHLQGGYPHTATQQMDIKNRIQLQQIRPFVDKLQFMSQAETRHDEYVPQSDPNKEDKEAQFPENIHGMFWVGNQAPNIGSIKEPQWLEQQEMHLWTGSKHGSELVKAHIENAGPIFLHNGFKTYFAKFEEVSNKMKSEEWHAEQEEKKRAKHIITEKKRENSRLEKLLKKQLEQLESNKAFLQEAQSNVEETGDDQDGN